ncbi:MAG: hypothetical protein OEY19_13190, partial [Gammaproteobacteria bacterium]|nr:hypothetical protein [Gammaproteobacteria bacterium]
VSSFIILSIYFLGKSLTDIKIAGLNLSGSNKDSISILAIIIIIFWLVMYLIYYRRDFEIQKEQLHLLMKHVNTLKERIDSLKVRIEKTTAIPSELQNTYTIAKNEYDVYKNQSSRTIKAGILNSVLNKIELWLPVSIAMFTVLILFVEYCFAYKIL